MYHFLTGSASWYVLTLLTMAYGVRGKCGDLLLMPQLVREEFDAAGQAGVTFQFAGKIVTLTYENKAGKEAGAYKVAKVLAGGNVLACESAGHGIRIKRAVLQSLPDVVMLKVVLE